ncbi:diguanylate cyclase [Legionella oakridgensis]|uniref:diguanylate cyclase n=1 Tax=Legionella oakridgensis TaxID=29423 RepID=UPI0003DE39F4|nr:diguanylate cyclase [Legionella oakridgensis]ETO92212.1 PAS domain S-box/diguanylate cyclase (GGDEF) domain protein [Legionella oakridgensis RV-2-2007]
MKLFKTPSINAFYRTAIATVSIFFLILYILVLYATYNQRLIIQSERHRYESLLTVFSLIQNADELTKMARLYAVTGNSKYKKYFYDILAIQDGRLAQPKNYSFFYWDYVLSGMQFYHPSGELISVSSRIKQLNFSQYEIYLLQQAEKRINELIQLAEKAFNFMVNTHRKPWEPIKSQEERNLEMAHNLLYGDDFLKTKASILQPLESFQTAVDIRTAHDFATLHARQQNILYIFQIIILFALLLCVLAYRYTSRRIVHPIRELHMQAEKVADGDYSVRNNIHAQNELETLGYTLNKMCGFIEKDISEQKNLAELLQQSEERFRNAIEYAPIGMAIKTLNGVLLQGNRALCEALGYDQNTINKLTNKDIIHPEDLAKEEALEQQLIHGEIKMYQHESRYIHKDGHVVWVLLSASLIRDGQGNPLNIVSQIHDITPRKRDEKTMAALNERMSATLVELRQREHENMLLNKMNELLLTCQDAEEAYSIIYLTAKELFPSLNGGLSIYNKAQDRLETVRQWGDHRILQSEFLPKDCWALRNGNIYFVDNMENSIICQHYISTPTGGYIDLPLLVRGETIGLLGLHYSQDKKSISPKQQQLAITFSENIKLALANIYLREALRFQAIRDVLTGLFNRRYLDETLPRELEQMKRHHSLLSIAMIDIDGFKKFNDEYGHEAGDEALKFVGNQLQQAIRAGDIACRLGGDEFIIILINARLNDAQQRIEQICEQVKNNHLHSQGHLLPQITLSAGIAEAPLHGDKTEDLMSAADEALYAAKKSGRDTVKIYQP